MEGNVFVAQASACVPLIFAFPLTQQKSKAHRLKPALLEVNNHAPAENHYGTHSTFLRCLLRIWGGSHWHGEGSRRGAISGSLCPGAKRQNKNYGERPVPQRWALPHTELACGRLRIEDQGGRLSSAAARWRDARRR